MVGKMKMTVAVAVGVSVGISVGGSVAVEVEVGGGSALAVCVWAAPAVATTMVSREPGAMVGFDALGKVGSAGRAHASKRSSAVIKGINFLAEYLFMVATQFSI